MLDLLAPFVSNHLEKMVSATVLSVLQTAEEKGVIVCDSRGRVLYCNDLARDLCSPLGQVGPPRVASRRAMRDHSRRCTGVHQNGASPAAGVASFVGYALSDPDALAKSATWG